MAQNGLGPANNVDNSTSNVEDPAALRLGNDVASPDCHPKWKLNRKSICRVVEQTEHEPVGIVIFKWCLILVGLGMLGTVLFLMGEVIYAWFSGQLRREHDWAIGNYTEFRLAKAKNVTLDEE